MRIDSINTLARATGLLYLGLLPLAFLGGFPYGLPHLFVPGDGAATANNIMAADSLFRLSIGINLLGAIVNVLVVLALFKLLEPINKDIASLMVVFLLLGVPIQMLNELNHVAALLLLSGANYLTPLTASQLQALVLLFHDLHRYGLAIAEPFWGLWLLPLGYLVFRSGFLPRILGILLIIGCFGWLAESVAAILLPNYGIRIGMFTGLGEILLPLWLLVKGVNIERWEKLALQSTAVSPA